MAKKLTPPFRSQTMAHLQDARSEFSTRLALDQKKVEVALRRTALMERQMEQRAALAATRRTERKAPSQNADFTARRAEIDAILTTARAEYAEQLLALVARWRETTTLNGLEQLARCCADVTKLAESLR
jgi:hypothetical protein